MINKLTDKQKKGIIEWREHCLKIGRDTSPINKKVVEFSWNKFYKILGQDKPMFWYCQSPLQAQIIINFFQQGIIKKIVDLELGDNIWANIRDNIGTNIGTNIRDNIGDNIGANIWANIRDNIGTNIRDNIRDNIGDNIWANIRDNIGTNIRDNKLKCIDTYSCCQHDINWIAYYKYFEKYGLLPHDKNFEIFNIWYDLACSCGWCYTFEKIIFVCEKPKILHLNSNGQLHKDNTMALEYSDGYRLYMLNGVHVPEEIVVTPAEKLNPKKALKEKNVDVQREIIRKIGAERMLTACNAKEIDIYTDKRTGFTYKLMVMKIGDSIDRKYLYFESAELKGVYYCQPIHPLITKVWQARGWMLSMFEIEELEKITEGEVIANLPAYVS